MKQMEHKQFDAIITDIDEPQGIVKAVFSVFGNVDQGGDRIFNGAFTKTFAEHGQKVLVLDNHNTQSTGDVIAKTISLRELDRGQLPPELQMKYPEATGGAELTAKFEPDKDKDPKSAAAFYRLKNDWLGEWSFGYNPLDFDYEQLTDKSTVRNLRTIKLFEVSPVLWGMNGATMTTDAKSDTADDTDDTDDKIAADKAADIEPDIDKSDTMIDEPEAETIEAETKAGAVLSAQNAAKLLSALQTITEVLQGAGLMDTEGDKSTGPLTEAKEAPTSTEAGPPEPVAPDYLNLIEISRQQLALLEVL